MPVALAYLGSYGGSDETDYKSILREYDDLSFREYRKSTAKHRTVVIPFKSISKTKRDALEAWFNANRFLDVYVYVWPEATAADPTGVATTGRHTARIRGSLTFNNESTCRYSTELTFKLLT